ncbi:hypothetical protein GobsT_43110 [Gemmata obscuriglobus]|uniref:Magnesium transporter MgtE intracellular domain-containing protein n=1 Tax=Gemmata obscuriglobus TaxID=114 RepID=A0A2Z3H1T0_9BACT|nr:hypothetical protein [Gemmata obscuriglobus]AWM37677.1 hypothetical protein C1280_12225 [Gemmata obscuriglobus]QEG29515.1 hypothetical protein GobsT_43110 [Gemmata obscuriglobus]VTS08703.1 unnamed protein product [Gemmata obscuriglobus UQM 2246]
MKNLLFLGAVALLLFSLSAALSLWLNQTRNPAEPDKAEKQPGDGKVISKAPPSGSEGAKEPTKETKEPTKDKAGSTPIVSPSLGPTEANLLDDKARLERKALQITMVLADVQAQRETTDELLKQVTAALKTQPKTQGPDATEQKLQKEREESLKIERQNLIKLAAIYDAMTPEGAAPNIKSMAESGAGKLEQVAQIMMLMKERNAARLMEALNDPALVAQLMDKMRLLRAQNTAIAPAPAPASSAPAFGTAAGTPSNVRPAGGP